MGTRLKLVLAVMAGVALAAADGHGARAAGADSAQAGGQERQLDPDLPGVGPQDQKFAETALATLRPAVDLSKLGAEKAQATPMSSPCRRRWRSATPTWWANWMRRSGLPT